VMHEEWINVSDETCKAVNETKQRKNKIIAVGTTSVRALESSAKVSQKETLQAFSGFTNLFIKPGDEFKVTDAMITDFHLPESTLIILVSAFAQSKMQEEDAGRKFVLNAYQQAINNNYRFYSFGDVMLLI